ncbi:hypothetical protein IWQ60_007837 [Tieghemiomyces parasiticus]|uniref:L-type lectin-like domain-containing protein n=1 Tax=Tieghemiomyces parasiticus TaxID=78921 RepID=A0A9W7ZV68_9FUNG|nr:hypothetical protein IWQ60_007837 [Tieghemiomyces parasiticus]
MHWKLSGSLSLATLASALLLAAGPADVTANMHVAHSAKRHDYKHGFKHPLQFFNDVPYWRSYGNATVTNEFVRLTSAIHDTQGSFWGTQPNPHAEWEAYFTFHISGESEAGSDGMAFWYTAAPGKSGPTYGNEDPFKGLGIIFHTYDEHEHKSSPFIMAYTNDGTVKLHDTHNLNDHMIGSCFHDVRRTHELVHARVTYSKRTLKLEVDATHEGEKFHECFVKEQLDLPTGYHFGFSASSGPQPDNHDVNSFDLYEVNPRPKIMEAHDSDHHHMDSKMRHQFDEIHEHSKEYHHHIENDLHRDQYGRSEEPSHEHFETNQMAILEALEALHSKLDMAGLHGKIPDAITGAGGAVHGTVTNEIMQDVKRLGRELGSIKSVVDRVAGHAHASAVGSGPSAGGADHEDLLHTILHRLDEIQHFLETSQGAHFDHAAPVHHGPPTHHAMSSFTLIGLVVAAQALVLVLFSFYKQRTAASKKYF